MLTYTGCPPANLIYVTRPHQLPIDSYTQITCYIDPLDLLNKDMDWPVLWTCLAVLKKKFGAPQELDGDTPLPQPMPESTEMCSGIRRAVLAGGTCLRRLCHQIRASSMWRDGMVLSFKH